MSPLALIKMLDKKLYRSLQSRLDGSAECHKAVVEICKARWPHLLKYVNLERN
jgi:hypothetical protein